MKALFAAVGLFALSATASVAATVDFHFGSSPSKTNQPVISQTVDGLTLDVTGIRCNDNKGPNHSSCGSADIDEWGSGIGLWANSKDSHQVDGYYKNEFLKLTLSKTVIMESLSFTYYTPKQAQKAKTR
eukprot:TRINITY_DN35071_c0_g1_i3.p1 TRINITY_DN35071_c0_g1~~TRINITY_DN35071_c0_g1_i3.p1  ORF type:complete len:129 (-),score=14.88 TRINITY_DN35071_c0_g1_i3:47-433(-)